MGQVALLEAVTIEEWAACINKNTAVQIDSDDYFESR